jgi:hypothetical protein
MELLMRPLYVLGHAYLGCIVGQVMCFPKAPTRAPTDVSACMACRSATGWLYVCLGGHTNTFVRNQWQVGASTTEVNCHFVLFKCYTT